MSYIGNPIISQAFLTDQFSGTGSATSFILTVAPANSASILVAVSGVLQDPSTYGVAGTTLTFSAAPPSGTANISVRYLGIPSTGVTSTAYRTITEITATAGQTTFTPASYTVGFLNVYQNGVLLGSADYTASNGTSVVLATGATVGDLLLFESFNVSSVLNAIPATPGAVSPSYLAAAGASKAFLDVLSSTGTGALVFPTGTTAQRPSSPVAGATRYNTTNNQAEYWNGTSWYSFNSTNTAAYSASYLIVAGGGAGGGQNNGGGGGAGGLVSGTTTLSSGSVYTAIIGGGASGGSVAGTAASGSNSSLTGLTTALGGGGAGGGDNYTGVASSGGSGGGAPYSGGTPGSGTVGQGNNGGNGYPNANSYGGGGGGGAGAVGGNASVTDPGVGGNGVSSTITGASVYYAGGGGGGCNIGTVTGGLGGGGAGAKNGVSVAVSGSANTGGGGGGATSGSTAYMTGGSGGSGVVILSVPTTNYTGTVTGSPTVTTNGSNTIIKFTSSGTYTA